MLGMVFCLLLLQSFKNQINPAFQLMDEPPTSTESGEQTSIIEANNTVPENTKYFQSPMQELLARHESPIIQEILEGTTKMKGELPAQHESYLKDAASKRRNSDLLLEDRTTNGGTLLISETKREQDEAPRPSSGQIRNVEYNGTNSFGACLMWMDDYNRLIEWIAYHYHVLPLRHLVIFRDPKSTMDPSPILDRWRPYMDITYWTSLRQFTYVPAIRILNYLKNDPVQHYKKQQGMLNRNCLNHLKVNNWTWTFLADTDEFLVLNKYAVPNAHEKMKQRGVAMDILKTAQKSSNNVGDQQDNESNVFSFQSERQQRRWGNATNVCVTMMRQQYSSFESPREMIEASVPSFLDPYRFQTMRFRYHRRKTMIGKSIVDASRVSVDARTVMSPHRVIRECGNPYGFDDDLMLVNHYIGSWDYFQRPNDNRGGEKRYQKFIESNEQVNASMKSNRANEVRPWLQGFVESFGKEKSLNLLEGAGFPYNSSTALFTHD